MTPTASGMFSKKKSSANGAEQFRAVEHLLDDLKIFSFLPQIAEFRNVINLIQLKKSGVPKLQRVFDIISPCRQIDRNPDIGRLHQHLFHSLTRVNLLVWYNITIAII